MNAVVVIAAIGVGTYLLRVSMFVVASHRPLPARLAAPLTFVGPAAVAALVAGLVATADGRIAPRALPEVVAVAAGYLVVRRTGNVIHAVIVGMAIVWVVAAIGW